jgi:hypothetical protein
MRYEDECSCGATRTKRLSIVAGERGSLVTINDNNGSRTRDTRNWQ